MRMIEEVGRLLNLRPFGRFRIVTSSGEHYDVPTPDHAGLNPRHSRMVVWFDDNSSVTLSSLHITAIEKTATPGT
ncbi:MAG: hypothetical protein JO331_05420 [Verrucomicrobia bacterium]|nr:hypothetical protein [Verrucomicrobiota bacterium]